VVDDGTRLEQGLGDVTDVIEPNLSNRPLHVIHVGGVAPSRRSRVVARRVAGR
jgi:hypothetical protein